MNHPRDPRPSQRFSEIWTRVLRGATVATDTTESQKLFGFRDGFRLFFESVGKSPDLRLESHRGRDDLAMLPTSDEDLMRQAYARVTTLYELLNGSALFCVASESGLSFHELDPQSLNDPSEKDSVVLVKTWVAVVCPLGSSFGVSGGVQLPRSVLDAAAGLDIPVPGHRRRGGMVGSLTRGLETRRSAIRLATLHALSTLFYGCFDDRNVRRW
jgi:non-canonical (house-cleaning) NTP pyrophosphatase